MSEQRDIVTPEAVVLGFERAGVASRAGAFALDLAALAGVYTVIFLVLGTVFGGLDGLIGAVVAIASSLGPYFAWFVTFEVLLQRTPGKGAFGLRVMGADGTPVRFTPAFLRTATGVIELVTLPFVGLVVALLSRNSQRLGDMAGRTMVVRDRSVGSILVPARFPPPYGYEGYVASLDVGAMSEREYELVRSFLLRASDLRPQARAQVAVALANPLAVQLAHNPPPNLHPETFLACCVASWQQTHAPAGSVPDAAVTAYGPYAGPPAGAPGPAPSAAYDQRRYAAVPSPAQGGR